MGVDAVSGQMSSDRFGGLGENGLMQYRHSVSGTEQVAQLAEQSGSDDHRVGRIHGDLDGDRRRV
jgi:hypothetical protein